MTEFVEWSFDDVEELAQLERLIFKDSWSIYAIASSLQSDAFYGYSLKEDGNIIAYYGFYLIAPECHVANVAVRSDKRGKGISKLLMNHLIETATKLGAEDFTLEVRPSNAIARHLYESYGFIEEGRRRKYYSDGEDALIYWKRKNS